MKEDAIDRAVRLSLLEKSEEERKKFHTEIEKILAFVDEVQSVDIPSDVDEKQHIGRVNVFRDDVVTVPAGTYREALLTQAPARHKDWFLSKKIL